MRNSIYLLIAATVISFSSCTEKVDFDLNSDENSRLVVEANLSDQPKVHTVKLTRTSSYYESQPAPKEKGAIVTFFDGTSYHSLNETSPGNYQTASNYKGEIGKNYTLNITTKNGDSYSATSFLASVAAVDSISYDVEIGENDDDEEVPFIYFYHYGKEPAGEGNNYMWLVDINGIDFTNKVVDIPYATDELVDGNYINGLEIYGVSYEKLDTTVNQLNVNIEFHSISRPYYDFLVAMEIETDEPGGLFSAPPANIPSNISNGGLGFFRVSAVRELNMIITDFK